MKNCSTAILSFRLATPAGLVILFVVMFVAGYLGAVLAEKMLAKKLDSVS